MTRQTCFIIRTSDHIWWQLTHTFQRWKWPTSSCELRENKCLFVHAAHANNWSYVTTQITSRGSGTAVESSYCARLNWGNSIRPLELRISYDGYIHSTPNFRMHNSFVCTQIAAWSLSAMQDITLYVLFVSPFIIHSVHYKTVSTSYVVEHKILHYI